MLSNSGTLQERWYATGTIVQVSIKDLDITLIRKEATIKKKSPSTAYRLPTGLTTRFRLPRAVGTDLPEYHLCSDTNNYLVI